MDSQKNEVVADYRHLIPLVPRVPVTAEADEEPQATGRLSPGWATMLAFAPLMLFIAIGEFAPEPTADPTTVGLAIGVAMLLAMGATAGLAMAHRISAAIPAIGLGAFGVYGQIDCAMQSHAATGTVGFWVITAAFAGLAITGAGGAASTLRHRS